MEEISPENNPNRRRRHSRKKKKNFFQIADSFFISDGISYRKERSIKKKRKKLLKKALEFTLWGIVIGILIFALIDMLSEVSIKDRRNTGKSTRKRANIDYPLTTKKMSIA